MTEKLSLYITDGLSPYRNLAAEEYLTLHTEPGECILFLWQNRNTVVIGRNQNAWKECRVRALEEDGGFLARRLSGGGAVFHDLGNLNFTFCVREEDYDVNRQLEVIVRAVRMLGIEAEKTGRNDVAADGRKFSGNAFYRTGGFCCHHGTLLIDTDKEKMARYLNVSREKLESKGVDSVRSRVVNLRELNPDISAQTLRARMAQAFGEVYGLPVGAFPENRLCGEEISGYEKFFSSWEWRLGKKLEFQHHMERRFSWGGAELQFQVEGGIVQEARVFSDGMEQAFIAALPEVWRGCRYEAGELIRAMEALQERAGCGAAEDIAGLLREEI